MVARRDRRRRAHAARPRQAHHDRRFRRRGGASGVRRAGEHARAERAGAAAARRRPRDGRRVGHRRRRDGVGVVGIYPDALLQTWDAALGAGTQLARATSWRACSRPRTGPRSDQPQPRLGPVEIAIPQAIATAIRKGMLIVAAAGNDGETGNQLTYPASLPHVLTVAATDEQNRVTSFSSRSRYVDLAAPGENITVASALDDSWAPEDGTSFASPLVAGAAAWVWTVRPELDASQLFEVMRRSAVDIGTRQGRCNRIRPAQRAGRTRVSGAGQRPARAERRHGLRPPGQDATTPASRMITSAKRSTALVARLAACRGSARPVSGVRSRPRHGHRQGDPRQGSSLGLWRRHADRHRGDADKNRLARGARRRARSRSRTGTRARPGRSTWPSRSRRAPARRRTGWPSSPAERPAGYVAANARTVNVPGTLDLRRHRREREPICRQRGEVCQKLDDRNPSLIGRAITQPSAAVRDPMAQLHALDHRLAEARAGDLVAPSIRRAKS